MQKNRSDQLNYTQLKKTMKRKWLEHRYEYDDEHRAVINMTVKDDSNFLSVYSECDTPVISTEVAEFIENSSPALNPKRPLTLRIHSNCIDDREKEDYITAIREYYFEKHLASKKEFRFNFIAILLLSFAGIAALALSFMVDHRIWSEVIDIAAWVFLWEAVDIGVFKNRESNWKRKRYMSYMTMKVEYLPLNNIDAYE